MVSHYSYRAWQTFNCRVHAHSIPAHRAPYTEQCLVHTHVRTYVHASGMQIVVGISSSNARTFLLNGVLLSNHIARGVKCSEMFRPQRSASRPHECESTYTPLTLEVKACHCTSSPLLRDCSTTSPVQFNAVARASTRSQTVYHYRTLQSTSTCRSL